MFMQIVERIRSVDMFHAMPNIKSVCFFDKILILYDFVVFVYRIKICFGFSRGNIVWVNEWVG